MEPSSPILVAPALEISDLLAITARHSLKQSKTFNPDGNLVFNFARDKTKADDFLAQLTALGRKATLDRVAPEGGYLKTDIVVVVQPLPRSLTGAEQAFHAKHVSPPPVPAPSPAAVLDFTRKVAPDLQGLRTINEQTNLLEEAHDIEAWEQAQPFVCTPRHPELHPEAPLPLTLADRKALVHILDILSHPDAAMPVYTFNGASFQGALARQAYLRREWGLTTALVATATTVDLLVVAPHATRRDMLEANYGNGGKVITPFNLPEDIEAARAARRERDPMPIRLKPDPLRGFFPADR